MKKTCWIIAAFFMLQTARASGGVDFEIRIGKADAKPLNFQGGLSNDVTDVPVPTIFITCTTAGSETAKFTLFVDGTACSDFTGNENKPLACAGVAADFRDKKLEIKKKGASTPEFTGIILTKRIFEVRFTKNGDPIVFQEDKSVTPYKEEVNKLVITLKEPQHKDDKYLIQANGETIGQTFAGDATPVDLKTDNMDLRDKTLTIVDATTKKQWFAFKLQKDEAPPTGTSNVQLPKISANDTLKKMFPAIAATQYGLQVPSGNRSTSFTGSQYVHIFLDQFGNNIFSTIPQGISNRQYVVHIFYLENKDDPNSIDYSINQTAGEFQENLVFNNAGQTGMEFRASGPTNSVNYRWAHKEFLLSTSTTNIQFDVIRTAVKDQTAQKSEFETQTLKTYTIKMSKVYHGSFDIGFINSTLKNPSFSLLASPSNAAEKVVKQNEGSNRGIVTVMATFYTSPIVLLESLLGSKVIPTYKLSGRNFLDDHKIYERIFPAVGVGFTDKTLENLFFGFDWEFARGGSIFAGWHYGKVNIYNAPDGFEYEKTATTQDEFNLRTNTAWKTNFAIGLNLDIMIVRNLFRTGDAGTGGDGK